MSDATRAVALAEAAKLNLTTVNEVLAAATAYDAWITGGEESPASVKTNTKPVATKPVATKPVVKPTSKTEDEAAQEVLEKQAAEAAAEEAAADKSEEESVEGDDDLEPTKEGAQAAIARLLKANKRKDAIGLLKKFGAASVSGIKPKDFAKFISSALALIPKKEAAEDDLTA